MRLTNRIVWSNGPLDISISMNDFRSGTKVIQLLSTEYPYLGGELPFKHRFVMEDPNTDNGIIKDQRLAFFY